MYPKLEPHVEGNVFRLKQRIFDFMKYRNASRKDIDNYLMSIVAEMSMRYSPRKMIPFTIGDIVDCNYGYHLESEICGGHIHAIVCNIIENNLVYLVPITKESFPYEEGKYLPVLPNENIIYHAKQFHGGTVSVKMGKYMDAHRFRKVIGEVNEDFFKILLSEIQKGMDFIQNIKPTEPEPIIDEAEVWDESLENPIDTLS